MRLVLITESDSNKIEKGTQITLLTYLVDSSKFRSFIWDGIFLVASGPCAYGFGSWPLKSDFMNCKFHLNIQTKSVLILKNTVFK